MSITVRCPTCAKMLQVSEKYAGSKGKCRSCGAQIVVPDRVELEQKVVTLSVPPPLPRSTMQPPPLKTNTDIAQSDVKFGTLRKVSATLVLLLIIAVGGLVFFFMEDISDISGRILNDIGWGTPVQKIKLTPAIYLWGDPKGEENAELFGTQIDRLSVDEFVSIAFRPPYLWESIPLAKEDVYCNTHSCIQFTAKTPESEPVQIKFLQEKEGSLILIREGTIGGELQNAEDLLAVLRFQVLALLGERHQDAEKARLSQYSTSLRVDNTYILSIGFFVGSTAENYEEIHRIRSSKGQEDTYLTAMNYVNGGRGAYLEPGTQIIFVEEFPDPTKPGLGAISVANNTERYFIDKKWLEAGIVRESGV